MKLKEKPKTFALSFTKWLERRVKTPYGRDNIRIEKKFDKHAKQNLWRVSAGVASASSQEITPKNQSEEQKPEHADNTHTRTGGNDTRRHLQEDRGPGAEGSQNASTSHPNTSSPSEDFAGVDAVPLAKMDEEGILV